MAKGIRTPSRWRVWGPLRLQVNGLVMTPKALLVAGGIKNPKGGIKLVGWQLGRDGAGRRRAPVADAAAR